MDIISVVCEAISSKKRLRFQYNNEVRVVEAHAVGWAKDQRPILLAWQASGGSSSGNPSPWRNFKLDEVSDLRLVDELSGAPREGFRRGGSKIYRVVSEV